MAFAQKLASVGTFGLAGLAANALFKKHKNNDNNNSSSLATSSAAAPPSLMNDKTAY
jgi:hypothetical protein